MAENRPPQQGPIQDQTQSALETWRQYITDSERQWNGFFREVLGTDTFSGAMNAYVESSLTIQRMVADQLERFYTTFNIPSHSDLLALGERMKAIEDTLARVESTLGSGVSTRARSTTKVKTAARKRPARTKRPASTNGVAARTG